MVVVIEVIANYVVFFPISTQQACSLGESVKVVATQWFQELSVYCYVLKLGYSTTRCGLVVAYTSKLIVPYYENIPPRRERKLRRYVEVLKARGKEKGKRMGKGGERRRPPGRLGKGTEWEPQL